MKIFGKAFIVCCIALLSFLQEPAYADEKASMLLQKAETALATATALTVEISGTISDSRPDRNPRVTFSATVDLMRPNFARIRYQESTQKRDGTLSKRQRVVVSDGENLWELDPERNEYRKRKVDAEGAGIDSPSHLPLGMFFKAHIPHIEVPPVYDGQESWNGQTYQVIEFRSGETGPAGSAAVRQRLYIGADNEVHRLINEQLGGKYREECVLSRFRTDTPLSAAQFVYAPPPGAKEYVPPAPPALLAAGTLAPDFTVMDRMNRTVKLSDFRGKVVVLDFWATWCGPCQESMPHTSAVAQKLPGDVVVLALNIWDRKDAFDAWLPKHPEYGAFTFVIDPSPQGKDIGTTLYRVSGIPTQYVIGKDGRIVRGFLGYQGPTADLENAVKAADVTQ